MTNETRLERLENRSSADVYCVVRGLGEDSTEVKVVFPGERRELMTLGEFRERFPEGTVVRVIRESRGKVENGK